MGSILFIYSDFVYNDAYFFNENSRVFLNVFNNILLEIVNFTSQLTAKRNIDCYYKPVTP